MIRIFWILMLIGCFFDVAHAARRSAPPPARLIDVHVHIWDPIPTNASFRNSLLAAFDTFHLERAVVSGPAELVPGAIALSPNRLLGGFVYGAGHELPPPAMLRTLFSTKRLAVFGEIDAAWRGEPLDSDFLEAYWTLSETQDIPAFIFTGLAPPGTPYQPCCPRYRTRLGRPEQLEEVLARHPKLRVNLMQAGWPYREETIALMQTYPESYVDLGNIVGNPRIPREEFYDYLRSLLRAGLEKRIMFGSGLSIDEWPAKIGSIMAPIEEAPFLTAEQRADIFYNNAVRFLRLNDVENIKPRR
jgi:predicted TIM-barrel fold metal-dependent hydrolase